MSKKKNKAAKRAAQSAQATQSVQTSQSADTAAKSNETHGVDLPRSNPENYITIEIPDTPDTPDNKAVSQPSPKNSKKDKNKSDKSNKANKESKADKVNKADKSANKPQSNSTDEKPSENAEPVDNSEKSAKSITRVKSLLSTLQDKAKAIKDKATEKTEKPEKVPLTQEQLDAKKKKKRTILSKTADVAVIVVLTIAAMLVLMPIFFAVMQSVKPLAELRDVPQSFFPKSFSLQTFSTLFASSGDSGTQPLRFLFNTLVIAAVITVIRIVITTTAAYILAKVKAPMLRTINAVINLSLVLTPALAYTMNYVLLVKTGLADTMSALILPYIASPLCLVLLRENIRKIPDETILAAKLEGCTHTSILRRIVLPQIKPAITAVTILTLFEAGRITGGNLTFTEKLDTLSAFMETLYNRAAFGELYALAVLMLIPVAVLLIVFRRSLLEAMTTAQLKEEK